MSRSSVLLALALSLPTAVLAQAIAMAPTRGAPPSPAQASGGAAASADRSIAATSVHPHGPPRLLLAAAAGVAAGLAVGEAGVSYAALPPDQRAARRLRIGFTFGAIGGALGAGWAALAAHNETGDDLGHSFWRDRWNTPLLAGIVAVQTLDYTSTRYFRDRNMPEWLLTDRLVDNRAAFVATEAASAAAAIALTYVLHRTGHHRWERIFAAGYVAMGVVSAVANYRYPTVGHALF